MNEKKDIVHSWKVDTSFLDRILTVETEKTAEEVKEIVAAAGFNAEEIAA